MHLTHLAKMHIQMHLGLVQIADTICVSTYLNAFSLEVTEGSKSILNGKQKT